jgi:hypothetical protein
MRDGWLVQEDLCYQYELLVEETLALRLLHEVETRSCPGLPAVRAALEATATAARQLVLWMEGVIFAHPGVVLVTGAPSAGKTRLIDHLTGTDAVCVAKTMPDLLTNTVTVYGYRHEGTATFRHGDDKTVTVTIAEYVQQSQDAEATAGPACFVADRAKWPVCRVQLIEASDVGMAPGAPARHGLASIDMVMYLVDASAGKLVKTDAQALHRIRAHYPQAAIHIVLTKADAVQESRLLQTTHAFEQQRRLFDGKILAYSATESAGSTHSRSRETIARMLLQRNEEQEDLQTQRYRELITEHMLRRQELHALVTHFKRTLAAQERGKTSERHCDHALYEAFGSFLNEHGNLDMRLP